MSDFEQIISPPRELDERQQIDEQHKRRGLPEEKEAGNAEKLATLRMRLQKLLKGRRQRLSVVDSWLLPQEDALRSEEVKKRYTTQAAQELKETIDYFQEHYLGKKFRSPDPLILDSYAAYTDNNVVSPPYPDGGLFIIEIKRTGKRPVSENLRIAKQVLR